MARRKLKKEEMRTDPFRQFLARTFTMTETSLEHHWQAYAAGFIAVVAAVAAIYYYVEYLKDRSDASSVLLNEAIEITEAPVLPPDAPQRNDYLKNGSMVFSTRDERSSELKKKLEELNSRGTSGNRKKAAMFLKASDLAWSGSYPEALKILDDLEKSSSMRVMSLNLKARIAESQKDTAKAEAIYLQMSKLDSEDLPKPMGLTILAGFYERQGKKAEALLAYEQALKHFEKAKKENHREKTSQPSAQQADAMETRLKERVKELKA